MEIPEKSYKVREVAEMLGCTADNVYRMIKYGQLEAFKVGGRANMRITDIALNNFIEKMKVRNEELKADGKG